MAKAPPRRRKEGDASFYLDNAHRAAADTLITVLVFILVVRAIALYGGKDLTIDYNKVAFLTFVMLFLVFILRCTKRSMSAILVNAVFFQLGSLFAKEFAALQP